MTSCTNWIVERPNHDFLEEVHCTTLTSLSTTTIHLKIHNSIIPSIKLEKSIVPTITSTFFVCNCTWSKRQTESWLLQLISVNLPLIILLQHNLSKDFVADWYYRPSWHTYSIYLIQLSQLSFTKDKIPIKLNDLKIQLNYTFNSTFYDPNSSER